MIRQNQTNQENFGLHGYFSAEKFLVLAPVELARQSKIPCFA